MLKKYLTAFDTEALYNAFKISKDYITPNVSLVREIREILFNKSVEIPVFKINGVTYTDKVITLAAGGTYELTGIHEGQIIIDANTIKPTTWTNIRLNGATIISDESYGILYDCPQTANAGYQGLSVTLEKDSQNFVICTKENATTDDATYASIDSWKDLNVQGVGYLAVYNNIGHGLRSETLNVAGPHIYVDVEHDGIHGKNVNVLDGMFYIQKAKDGFGTTDNGCINIFGGEFEFINVTQDQFDSAKQGVCTVPDITAANIVSIENAFTEGTVTAYPTKADYEAGENGVVITPVLADIKSGTYHNADSEGNAVENATYAGNLIFVYDDPEEQIFSGLAYIIDKQYNVVEVTGKITASILRPLTAITVDEPTFSKKGKLNGGYDNNFDIYLNNAVIVTSIDSPSIANLPDAGRVKITAVKDTINAVINTTSTGTLDLDAIKSENNIIVEAKNGAVLYVTSAGGDGIDGGDTKITDSKGAIVITKCAERGIKGTYTVIGPNADIPSGIINPYTDPADTTNYNTFDGVLIVKGNAVGKTIGLADETSEVTAKASGYADVYGRNGKHTKGKVLFTDAELKGVAIIGSIGARDSIDLGNAKNLYYKEILLDAIHPVTPVVEQYKAVPYNETPIV
jgi:hypothetical protein